MRKIQFCIPAIYVSAAMFSLWRLDTVSGTLNIYLPTVENQSYSLHGLQYWLIIYQVSKLGFHNNRMSLLVRQRNSKLIDYLEFLYLTKRLILLPSTNIIFIKQINTHCISVYQGSIYREASMISYSSTTKMHKSFYLQARIQVP